MWWGTVDMRPKWTEYEEPTSYQVLLDENRALQAEIDRLRERLAEAEELKRAISEGDLSSILKRCTVGSQQQRAK